MGVAVMGVKDVLLRTMTRDGAGGAQRNTAENITASSLSATKV